MTNHSRKALTAAQQREGGATRFESDSVKRARSAIGRRRSASAVVATLGVIAAASLGTYLAGMLSSGGELPLAASASDLQLMTQPEFGDSYPAALASGTLVVTTQQCLALSMGIGGPGEVTVTTYAIHWPKGFTAERDSSGKAALFNAERELVAKEGDEVMIGGGLMPGDFDYPQRNHACAVGAVRLAAPDVTRAPER